MIINQLQSIFANVSLSDIDSSKEIEETQAYSNFLKTFPNISEVFKMGINRDREEFLRTIKHIFRSIKIYLNLLSNSFIYEGFSNQTISLLSKKISNLQEYNALIIPIILIYHDIGKFIRKRDHPHQSFVLITKKNLLSPFTLTKNDTKLIQKVIQYHILFATIYTGESTFYGSYSIINDLSLVQLLSDNKYINLFVDLLEIFTFIDILGYSYSQIFDHYAIYYEEINHKLKDILKLLPIKEKAIQKALQYSKEWIEWRIAGGLRNFQFIGTQSYLTEEFYYDLIKTSLNSIPFEKFNFTPMKWEDLEEIVLKQSCKIQIKYGLAFLMILAFGSFHRASLKENAKVSHKLLLFWMMLCRETNNRSKKDPDGLWNVYVLGILDWFALSRMDLTKLDENLILKVIQKANSSYNEELREYTLNLDLSIIFNQ
ncbi:MAG: hypothetical protein ACXABG_09220 [Promethearchaeota archaeon]